MSSGRPKPDRAMAGHRLACGKFRRRTAPTPPTSPPPSASKTRPAREAAVVAAPGGWRPRRREHLQVSGEALGPRRRYRWRRAVHRRSEGAAGNRLPRQRVRLGQTRRRPSAGHALAKLRCRPWRPAPGHGARVSSSALMRMGVDTATRSISPRRAGPRQSAPSATNFRFCAASCIRQRSRHPDRSVIRDSGNRSRRSASISPRASAFQSNGMLSRATRR